MIITISGAIGAGKDTLGDLLVDAFEEKGYRADTAMFAAPIKEVASQLGFNVENRDTKEIRAPRPYNPSALSDAIFNVMQYLPMFDRRLVAVQTHQKLLRLSKVKVDGVYVPNVSAREFMQTLGGVVRNYDENYYTKHLTNEYTPMQIMVVTDCRHLNEQACGFYKVYVQRDNNPYRVDTSDSSEAYQKELLLNADTIVYNFWSVSDLEYTADKLANTIIGLGGCEDAKKSG